MPRKRVGRTKRATHVLTGDFAKALEGFQEASGLTWAEIARRLGTASSTCGGGGRASSPTCTTSSPSRTSPTAWAWATCSPG